MLCCKSEDSSHPLYVKICDRQPLVTENRESGDHFYIKKLLEPDNFFAIKYRSSTSEQFENLNVLKDSNNLQVNIESATGYTLRMVERPHKRSFSIDIWKTQPCFIKTERRSFNPLKMDLNKKIYLGLDNLSSKVCLRDREHRQQFQLIKVNPWIESGQLSCCSACHL